jgi:hypothetical protein
MVYAVLIIGMSSSAARCYCSQDCGMERGLVMLHGHFMIACGTLTCTHMYWLSVAYLFMYLNF